MKKNIGHYYKNFRPSITLEGLVSKLSDNDKAYIKIRLGIEAPQDSEKMAAFLLTLGNSSEMAYAITIPDFYVDGVSWIDTDVFAHLCVRIDCDKFADFIEAFWYFLDWSTISLRTSLSDDFAWRFRELLDWSQYTSTVLYCADCLEARKDFVDRFKHYIDWRQLSGMPDMPSKFVDRNFKYLRDYIRSFEMNARLEEWLIHKYRKELDWEIILCWQDMSEKFVECHEKEIDDDIVLQYNRRYPNRDKFRAACRKRYCCSFK